MITKTLPSPVFHAHGANGIPLIGGQVFTYEAGTATPKATYQDAGGSAANTNPVILNARGETVIYWDKGLYKVRLEDAGGTLIYEVDNFDPQVPLAPANDIKLVANGSFETDSQGVGTPDNWTLNQYVNGTVSGIAELDRYDVTLNPDADPFNGTSSLSFTHKGGPGNGGGWAESDLFEVGENRAYFLSFAIKSTAPNAHNTVAVHWFNTKKELLPSVSTPYDNSTSNPTDWTHNSYPVTAPTTACYARVILYGGVNSNTVASTVHYDDVDVIPIEHKYLRADVADTVAGAMTFNALATFNDAATFTGPATFNATTTFSVPAVLNNTVPLQGKDNLDATVDLMGVDDTNNVVAGSTANPLFLQFPAGDNLRAWDGTNDTPIWHSGNDGAGTGLDADKLDGWESAELFVPTNALAEISTAPDTPGGVAPDQATIDTRQASARTNLGIPFTAALAVDGGYTLPGGVIMKWAESAAIAQNIAVVVSFSSPFPTGCLHVFALNSEPTTYTANSSAPCTHTLTIAGFTWEGGSDPTPRKIRYLAIGH
jgi:hypothetical protein